MKTKGWGHVFRFTFIQTIKAKSFIVSTIVISAILVLLIAGVNFLPLIMMDDSGSSGADGSEDVYKIRTVYLLDESGIEPKPDFSSISQMGVTFTEVTKEQYDEKIAGINQSSLAETALYISAPDESGYISMLMSRPKSEEVITADDCKTLLADISAAVSKSKLIALGVSEENVAAAEAGISKVTTVAGEPPVSEFVFIIKSVVPMISSLVLFMFIFAYGQMVAQAIATEKTSKVMELLLTSIKPLAVIIGKVLAIGCVALAQMAIIGTVSGASAMLMAPLGFIGKLSSGMTVEMAEFDGISEAVSSVFANVNIGSVLLFIVVFALGFLFYALIAGLAGASISRMEDLSSAIQPMSLVGILGFYLAYFPTITSMEGGTPDNIFILLSRYLPISSPFALPGAVFLGEMSGIEAAISIGVLALFVALMALLVAKVYETIILHNGDRIKFGQMIKMAGEKK